MWPAVSKGLDSTTFNDLLTLPQDHFPECVLNIDEYTQWCFSKV